MAPSSMHRVFSVADLAHMILSWLPYVKKTPLSPSRQRFLASIASVNVPIRNAVTAILWRDLKTFAPLFRLIPLEPGWFAGKPFKNSTSPDWSHWDYYSPFVLSLRSRHSIVDKRFSAALIERALTLATPSHPHNPTRYLLPNIRSLDCMVNAAFGDEDLRILRSLLSPSLTSLRITVRWSSYLMAEFASLVEELRFITPVLTEFELIRCFVDIVEPQFAKSVLRIPTDLESLQRLGLDTDTFIAAADQLPVMKTLVSLRLAPGNRRSTAAPPPSLSIPKSVFPAPQTIAGSQDDVSMQILTKLIPSVGHSIMHFEASRTSTIDRWEATEPVSLDRLFDALSESCPLFQSCKISRLIFAHDYIGRYVHASNLLPMRLHSSLICLKLSSEYAPDDISVQLSDERIAELAKAYPCLEVLHLADESNCSRRVYIKPTLSLQAVHVLTRACLHLQSLKITLDADICPPLAGGQGLPRSSLRALDFGASRIGDPEAVAIGLVMYALVKVLAARYAA